MPLLTPNNPTTDSLIMAALANILVGYPSVNTAIGAVPASPSGYGPVFIQREFDLSGGRFPAILIAAGRQSYKRSSSRGWQGSITLDVDYYDDYTQRPDELDDIRAAIATDLERCKANVESNPILAQNNTAYTVDMYSADLSPYEGITRDVNGMKLIYRRLTLSFWILPYNS